MAGNKKTQSGFALLVSLIVVGAVLSIGLAILDLSIKQVKLAATTKDSEIAFHAANAGMECARYWRRQASTSLESGGSSAITCFSATAEATGRPSSQVVSGVVSDGGATIAMTGSGNAYVYEYEFTWGAAPDERCTTVTTIVAVASLTAGLNVTNMRSFIPGYPAGTLSCGASSQCTVASAQGYNRPCNQKTGFGTIQREVLLEF